MCSVLLIGDGQLWNSAVFMLETESENGVNRSSLWDDKDGAIANGAQKCNLQLHFGKRIQREMFTLLNLSMGQNCSKHPKLLMAVKDQKHQHK